MRGGQLRESRYSKGVIPPHASSASLSPHNPSHPCTPCLFEADTSLLSTHAAPGETAGEGVGVTEGASRQSVASFSLRLKVFTWARSPLMVSLSLIWPCENVFFATESVAIVFSCSASRFASRSLSPRAPLARVSLLGSIPFTPLVVDSVIKEFSEFSRCA